MSITPIFIHGTASPIKANSRLGLRASDGKAYDRVCFFSDAIDGGLQRRFSFRGEKVKPGEENGPAGKVYGIWKEWIIHRVIGAEGETKIWLNVRSLAKRLGVSRKEVKEAHRNGKLDELIAKNILRIYRTRAIAPERSIDDMKAAMKAAKDLNAETLKTTKGLPVVSREKIRISKEGEIVRAYWKREGDGWKLSQEGTFKPQKAMKNNGVKEKLKEKFLGFDKDLQPGPQKRHVTLDAAEKNDVVKAVFANYAETLKTLRKEGKKSKTISILKTKHPIRIKFRSDGTVRIDWMGEKLRVLYRNKVEFFTGALKTVNLSKKIADQWPGKQKKVKEKLLNAYKKFAENPHRYKQNLFEIGENSVFTNKDGHIFIVQSALEVAGSQKKAYKCFHLNTGKAAIALNGRIPGAELDALNQVNGMRNVIKTISVGKIGKPPVLFQPYFEETDLYEALRAKKAIDEEATVAEILASSRMLHRKAKLLHRDIKPENYLVGKNKKGKQKIALTDFGFAQSIRSTLRKYCGSVLYMAPEFARTNGQCLSKKTDSWALGVLFHETFLSNPPMRGLPFQKHFLSLANKAVADELLRQKTGLLKPEDQDQVMADPGEAGTPFDKLLFKLLQVDVKKRITPEEAFRLYLETC